MPSPPQSVPPRFQTPAPPLGLVVGVMVAFVGLGAGAVLFFFNPTRYHFYPVCMFHELTGCYCPGCGGTRAAYELLHGHLWRAFHDNALFLLVLAGLMGQGAWYGVKRLSKQAATLTWPPAVLWTFLVVAVIFTVLRNLPAFAFLAPLAH